MPDPIKSLPPTLVIHGEADRVIPIADGTKLAAFAIHLGVQNGTHPVLDDDHGFDLAKDDARSGCKATSSRVSRRSNEVNLNQPPC